MMNDTEIDELIVKFLSRNATRDEAKALLEWVNSSEVNRLYYIKRKAIWYLSAKEGLMNIDSKIAHDKVTSRISEIDHKNFTAPFVSGKVVRMRYVVRVAASVIAIMGFSALATYFVMDAKVHKAIDASVQVTAPMGSKAITILPDGTKVWLNAGSNLKYNNANFNQKDREIYLEGEAYFQVVTNKNKPFVVNAKGLHIKPLGTEFNVKAYPEEDVVETTLVKGIVKLQGKNSHKDFFSILMNPKQKITYHVLKLEKKVGKDVVAVGSGKNDDLTAIEESAEVSDMVDTELFTAWKDDRLILNSEKLGALIPILERRYNVQISLDSEELKDYQFSGTFKNETLEQVMQLLKLTAPIKYEIGKGVVKLSVDKSLKLKYSKYMM